MGDERDCVASGHAFERVSTENSGLIYYHCARCDSYTWRHKDSVLSAISVPPPPTPRPGEEER